MHQVGGRGFVDINASSELNKAGRDNERDDCNNGCDYWSFEINSREISAEIRENLSDDSYKVHTKRMLKKIREKVCLSTAINGDLNRHRAHVCAVCDCLIIGLEEVKLIHKLVLLCHSDQLSVSAYEEYYDKLHLHPEVVKQY